jgi:hypothetical protein
LSSIPDVPESQFLGVKTSKLHPSKARRKNFTVTVLPPGRARGVSKRRWRQHRRAA